MLTKPKGETNIHNSLFTYSEEISMHIYRSHNCGQLRLSDAGTTARLSGWIHRKRDHGNLVFIDLRDHYGLTQCVVDVSSPVFKVLERLRPESVICVTGKVVKREGDTVNKNLPTGEIELHVEEAEVLSEADILPMQVAGDYDNPEDVRLRYRFWICAAKSCITTWFCVPK